MLRNNKTIHTIVQGDARQMTELSDQSVHLIVTSPPYWQLKDYGAAGQIGYSDSYEDYVNHLNLVWAECYRTLKNGCRLCINIGDQFARAAYYGRYKIIPIRTEIIKFCETIGLDYMGAIIWQKSTTMNTSGGGAVMGSFPFPRNGIVKLDYEFILLFKKGGMPEKVDKKTKELSKLSPEEWNLYFQGHWRFAGVRQNGHLAMFPEELPKRLIKMFSFAGETVLDPFAGGGTTSIAAKKLGRNSVGYEINPRYAGMIKTRLTEDGISAAAKPRFVKQKQTNGDYQKQIANLPYVFKDAVKLNLKTDPKKMNFGSTIDGTSPPKKRLFVVQEIINGETLALNDNLRVKLLGVKTTPQKSGEAADFLKEKTLKKKVFLAFEERGKNGELFCYLYLQNKTFINAHLIKNGLAKADITSEHKYKSKFIGLEKEAQPWQKNGY